LRAQNLHEILLIAAAKWGHRAAFRHVYGGKVREIAYEDLPRLTYLFGQSLIMRGVQPGDRVVLCADNCPEWVIACISAFRIGVTVVPVDSRSRQADIEMIGEKVKPTLYLLGRMQFGVLRESLDESRVVLLDEILNPIANQPEATDRPMVHFKTIVPETTALIVFTSGTSGVSKGVMLSHANIVANVMEVARTFPVEPGDKFLSILPLSHMFEYTAGCIAPLVRGATLVFSRLRGPEHLRQLLKVEKINALIGVPAIYQNVLKAIEARIAGLEPGAQTTAKVARKLVGSGLAPGSLLMKKVHAEFGGRIKFWAAGGAPVPEPVVRGLASFGIPVLAGYGLTEASPIVSCNMIGQNRPGSVGKPVRNVEVRIEQSGEIVVRGPSIMQGYFGDEAATNEVLKDGWLYTGDIGRLDSDGYLYVTGRLKSTIVTGGGYNIHPEELEYALEQSPMIKEASVFGVASEAGEQAHAIIVPTAEYADRASEREMFRAEIARCVEDLAEYKRLSGFEVYQGELPRTRTNKIQRNKAAELYEALRSNAPPITAPETAELSVDEEAICTAVVDVMDPAMVERLGVEAGKLPLKANLAGDLGVDSFARLELAVRLEQLFGVIIAEEAVNDVQTVAELITLVKSQKRGEHDGNDVVSCESNNFDGLMNLYASMMPDGSAQRNRLLNAIVPWPHGRHAIASLKLTEKPAVQEARKQLVAGMRLAMRAYNQYECFGVENLEIEPPYIVVANHAIFAAFPKRLVPLVHPVAASDLFFRNRLAAEISANLINAVPFDRYGEFEKSMAECRALLRDKQILIIFPEGTRSTTGKVGPFRSGASQLAIDAQCKVVPAYIEGSGKVLPKQGKMLRPGKITITFGTPIEPPENQGDLKQIQQFSKLLQDTVVALSNDEE
jgi:long-chain acyl-CoA synthetase